MKRAKVSSVFEGRRKKRTREEVHGESKIARMKARARKYSHRGKARALCPRSLLRPRLRPRPTPTERTMVTRSMATTSDPAEENENQEMGEVATTLDSVVDTGNQEMGEVVVVVVEVEVKKEEERSEIKVVEEMPVGGVVEMPEEGFQALEDWPQVWSYEEEWLWMGTGMMWDPNWELMTGDVWVGGEVVENGLWEVDIWT